MNRKQWRLRGYFYVFFGIMITMLCNTSTVKAEMQKGLNFEVQVAFQEAKAEQVNIDLYQVEDLSKIKNIDGDDGYVMDPTNIPMESLKTDIEGQASISTLKAGHYIAYAWGNGYDDIYNAYIVFSVNEKGEIVYEGTSQYSVTAEHLSAGNVISEPVVMTLRPRAAVEVLMVGNQDYLQGNVQAYNYEAVTNAESNFDGTTYQIFLQDQGAQAASSKIFNTYATQDGNTYEIHGESGNRTATVTGDQIIYLKPNTTYFFQQEKFSNSAPMDTNKPYNFFVSVGENGNITQVLPDDKTGEIYGYSPLWGKKINVNSNGEVAIEKSNNEKSTLIVAQNERLGVVRAAGTTTDTGAMEQTSEKTSDDAYYADNTATYSADGDLSEADYIGDIPDNFQLSTVDGVYIKYDDDGNPIGYFTPTRGANGEIIWVEYGAREGDLPYKENPETLDTLSFARIAFVGLIFGVVFVVDRKKAREIR